MADPQPPRGFRVPAEVPHYFADRGLKPGFSWLDVWGEEHAHAFTVAKAVDVELLTTLRDSIKHAIEAGQGFETWRAALRPELERIGWGKPRLVVDPTGERPDRMVDFTSPRRLQTIFSANMRAARAAGQWDRIQRTKGALPYLIYVRSTAAEPRPQHLAWAGTILPADDPFWGTHFPPNGWQCKCAVRQVSRFERDKKLGQDGYSSERPAIEEKPFLNRRTGEIVRVPDGIDPGWGHNPGLAAERRRAAADGLTTRIEAAAAPAPSPAVAHIPRNVPPAGAAPIEAPASPPGPAVPRKQLQAGVADLVQSETFERHHAEAVATATRRTKAARTAKAAGADKPAQDRAADAAAPWTRVNLPVAVLPERLDGFRRGGPVTVTASDAAIGESHQADPTRATEWAHVQAVLDRGEIQMSADEPGRLWGFARIGGREVGLALSRLGGAWRALRLFRPAHEGYRADQRARAGRAVLLDEVENDAGGEP